MFEVLFQHWSSHAFEPMAFDEMKKRVQTSLALRGAQDDEVQTNVLPDLAYLMELGAIVGTNLDGRVVDVRLSAAGIDLYEQLVLRKYEF